MKKLNLALVTASIVTCFLLTSQLASAQTRTTSTTKATTAEIQPMETLSLNFEKVVPADTKYVIYDSRGRKILDLKAGSSTAEVTDCAQIPCPSTFGDDVVCWKCVERITTNQGSTE